MFAHFNGLTLAALIIVPALVILGFGIYANHGIKRRYTVRRGSHIVSRHWTESGAKAQLAELEIHASDTYTIKGN